MQSVNFKRIYEIEIIRIMELVKERAAKTNQEQRLHKRSLAASLSSLCHHCGCLGHWKSDCPTGITCFACRRVGHIVAACPAKFAGKAGKREMMK